MIFRLSNKLKDRIEVASLETSPPHEHPLMDWSAHLFFVGDRPYILVSSTKSLYSAVLPATGITNGSEFLARALSGIREMLKSDSQEAVYQQHLASAAASVESVVFAKALNRSVTGSMTELTKTAMLWLAEGGVTHRVVGTRLNDTLLSALATSKSDGYGKPREAFKTLLRNLEA